MSDDEKPDLASLANEAMGPLSGAEERLAAGVGSGQPVDLKAAADPDRQARSSFIRWLCVDAQARLLIHARGIQLNGAVVSGDLDLEGVDCPFPLVISESRLEGVDLDFASFPRISLRDSEIDRLSAERLALRGPFGLRNMTVHGRTSLRGASIPGALVLSGARLGNRGGVALDLQGVSLGGSLELLDGFRADGQVRIVGARLHSLACEGVLTSPRGMPAFLMESSSVEASVLMRWNFRAVGEVRFFDMKIGGSLDLQAARLTARGSALLVDGTRIGGALLISRDLRSSAGVPLRCRGGMRVVRTSIAGHVNADGARFRAVRRAALDFADTRIDGRLQAMGVVADGETVLVRATVGNDIALAGARLSNPRGPALRARGLRCGGSILLNDGFAASGTVAMQGVDIGDEFNAASAHIHNAGDVALSVRDGRIRSAMVLRDGVMSGRIVADNLSVGNHADLTGLALAGELVLSRAQVGGYLLLDGATCINDAGAAITADGLRCGGGINMRRGFNSAGRVDFAGSTVAATVLVADATMKADDVALSFAGARIGGNLFVGESALGATMDLSNANVDQTVDVSRSSFASGSGSHALLATRLTCGGDVRLADGFEASGIVRLDRARIGGSLGLAGSRIAGKRGLALSLVGAHVQSDIDAGLSMGASLDLSEARWLGALDAKKINVEGNVDLSVDCRLDDASETAIGLDRATIKGSLTMDDAFRTNGVVDLRNATLGGLVDEESSWSRSGGIVLDGLTYTSLSPLELSSRMRWLDRRIVRASASATDPDAATQVEIRSMQPHEQLVQVMKRHGYDREARRIAIDKQSLIERQMARRSAKRVGHAVYGATMGYGYRPQRALMFAPIFVLGLAIAFWTGATTLMTPTDKEARAAFEKHAPLPNGYPSFNALAYSIDAFVPVLNLQQRDSWRPDDRVVCSTGPGSCATLLRVYLWIHVAMGWIITTLALAGFSGLVRKD